MGCQSRDAERQWAEIQSRSWPPWKKPRLGIEVEELLGEGDSATVKLLNQAEASGIVSKDWETAVGVLGGRDVDDTPTIQQRGQPVGPSRPCLSLSIRQTSAPGQRSPTMISNYWTAKIIATRTLDEAWAAFLDSSQDSLPSVSVHIAFLGKVCAAERLTTRRARQSSVWVITQLPGESKEPMDPPLDPNEGVYVPSPPPTSKIFITESLKRGLGSSSRYIVCCLRHARSSSQATTILNYAVDPGIQKLVSVIPNRYSLTLPRTVEHALHHASPAVFAAIIDLLSRLAHLESLIPGSSILSLSSIHNRLDFIVGTLIQRRWRSTKTWNRLLNAMLEILKRLRATEFEQADVHGIWSRMCRISRNHFDELVVERNMDTVLVLLRAHQAMTEEFPDAAGLPCSSRTTSRINDSTEQDDVHHQMQRQVVDLRTLWYESLGLDARRRKIVSGEAKPGTASTSSSADALPSLFRVPSPGDIHCFVRSLSAARDEEGLIELIGFFRLYQHQLRLRCTSQPNGEIQMRHAICAISIYARDESKPSKQGPKLWHGDIHGSNPRKLDSQKDVKRALNSLLEEISWLGGPVIDHELQRYSGPASIRSVDQDPSILGPSLQSETDSLWERPLSDFGNVYNKLFR